MKTFVLVTRRIVLALVLLAAIAFGGVLGLSKLGIDILPPYYMGQTYAYADFMGAKARQARKFVVGRFDAYFHKQEESHHEHSKIVVTTPKVQEVTITESFVCQIRSQRHIEVRALEGGYLSEIKIKEGQAVKAGDVLFRILPVLYKARYDAEVAEADLAQIKRDQAKKLLKDKVVSDQDLKMHEAELAKARAKMQQALAELNFTEIKAPFDGIVDRLLEREGSLIKEGDILTTLADNSLMWVYYNVPEKYYLQYMANRKQHEKEDTIELLLASGDTFPQTGTIGAIEADFNNENGNIKFRADFPNPDRLLRHGQTGTIKIRRPLRNALLIPQRATFELLDKQYVWVVGEDHVAHQALITVKYEQEDIFVIDKGLRAGEKIVLEGVREVQEGGKVEYEFRKPEEALKNQKFHAE